ncbi:hypothetical protein [Argonema galeatum]|uniref:hypothetical protein n=1 Tax=Argonema galeatum TaxID=2942762 RepID=UPI002012AD43|nr:hypothetical protein [Argonema galeatum]MCL1468247.1 hypothetical protein [Argonema galeatum A003/A1]
MGSHSLISQTRSHFLIQQARSHSHPLSSRYAYGTLRERTLQFNKSDRHIML